MRPPQAWRPDGAWFLVRVVSGRRDSVEEFVGTSDAGLSRTARDQTVMPDAVEARG
uniref:hypothetical protein n=1 Tax=Pseudorhizobium xiangyangii TaxID=2883104 RepID=UPI0028F3F19A|nr:hypothetical protein [Neorhizobium xiangyangii]